MPLLWAYWGMRGTCAFTLGILGKERVGPFNLVEVASPFHAITTIESVRTLFTCPVYTWLSEHVGEEEGGSLQLY